MKAIIDVDYREAEGIAACVVFDNWSDEVPLEVLIERISPIAAYEPGNFYKRELPCIVSVLKKSKHPIDLLIVDGFVWLGPDHPGLGVKAHEALNIPVIGVAKTNYHGSTPIEVLRGQSKKPLFVTAIGVDAEQAAKNIQNMHGDFRIPTLLKLVDASCRQAK